MRNYEYLVAVASHGHFGKAAQECCVTQPTLSLGIKELERQLGFDLIHRERRYMGLTEEGEIVVAYAQRMLRLRSSMKNSLRLFRTEQEMPLIFGTVPSGVDVVAHFATRLSKMNMSQSFVAETVARGDVMRAVLDGNVDLGITHLDDCTTELHLLADLQGDQPYLVAPHSMRLDGACVSAKDIQGLPICHLSMESYGTEIQEYLSANATQGTIPRLCAGSVQSVMSYLEQNYWYAVVPRGLMETINHQGAFWSCPILTKAESPRLAIVSRPMSSYFGKKLEVIEYLRKTALQYVTEGPQLPKINNRHRDENVEPLRRQNPAARELI